MSASAAPIFGAATIGRRAAAYLVDTAIAWVILLLAAGAFAGISVATGGGFPLWVAGVAAYAIAIGWFVVYTALQAGRGSLGMRALGLRLSRMPAEEGAAPLGFGAALLRNIIWGLGAAIVVGYFSNLFDSSPWRRGWHDRVSGAVMTDVAGRGVQVALAGHGEGAETDAAASPAFVPSALTSAVPSSLPAAPILPVDEDTALAGWTPAGATLLPAPARAPSGVISFVPGVSPPETADPYAAPPTPRAAPPTVVVSATPPASTAGEEPPLAHLVWDDGTRHALFGRAVFGRNPTAETGAMVYAVRDETLSLSKTHFEIVPGDGHALYLIDRHSTNGVVLRRGAERRELGAGERVRVRSGDALDFGDRSATIEALQ